MFFNYCAEYARERAFLTPFSCPFCRFPFSYLLLFSFIFSAFSRKHKPKLFVLELGQLFYGHPAIQSKKLPNL